MKKENASAKGANVTVVPTQKAAKPTPEEIQKQLQEQIENFQRINNIIRDRKTFMDKKEALNHFLDEHKEDPNSFEQQHLKIKLTAGEWRDDTILTIANTELVKEFIQFISGKIDNKVVELEKEILL